MGHLLAVCTPKVKLGYASFMMFIQLSIPCRVLLVVIPTSGYVHPDEYFQTVEVVVGDVFDTEVTRTWEVNATSAMRSMTVNTIVFGGPLYVLRVFDYLTWNFLGISLVVPYIVKVIPRLTMLTLSFVVDWCVYQICVLYKHNFNQCLSTLASSMVMLVYSTRSFTDSLELVYVLFKP